jgi:hypothetical protein
MSRHTLLFVAFVAIAIGAQAKAVSKSHYVVKAAPAAVVEAMPAAAKESNLSFKVRDQAAGSYRVSGGTFSPIACDVQVSAIAEDETALDMDCRFASGGWTLSEDRVKQAEEKHISPFVDRLRNRFVVMSVRDVSSPTAAPPAVRAPRQAELVIYATTDRLKNRIVDDFISSGFKIGQETDHQLTFYRDAAADRTVLGYLIFGETLPKAHRIGVAFTIVPRGNETRVVATAEIYTQNGYGYGVLNDASQDPQFKNQVDQYLAKVKQDLEVDVLQAK